MVREWWSTSARWSQALWGDFQPSIVNFLLRPPSYPVLCWHQTSQCPLLSRPQGHVLALVRGPGFHSQHHAWYFSPLVSPQLCSFPISVTWDKVCAKSSISGTYHALAFLGPLNMAFTPSLLDSVIHFPRLSSDFTSSENPSLITPSRVMGGPFLWGLPTLSLYFYLFLIMWYGGFAVFMSVSLSANTAVFFLHP